jgi:hypothetical protein
MLKNMTQRNLTAVCGLYSEIAQRNGKWKTENGKF